MIAFIRGQLLEKYPDRVIVDVNGIGYEVRVPLSTFYGMTDPDEEVSFHVHTHVREDALTLFGFATNLELKIFERLIAVNGVGPKLALAVLSGIEPVELVQAVRDGDVARLTLRAREESEDPLFRLPQVDAVFLQHPPGSGEELPGR